MKNFQKFGLIALVTLCVSLLTFTLTDGHIPITALVTGATVSLSNFVTIPTDAFALYVGAATMGEGTVNVISTERERATYEHNKTDGRFAGKNMTPGFLRLEATIINSSSVFDFKTFDGDGSNIYPTERRLDRNDAFICDSISVFLLKQDVANKKTNGRLVSYPSQQIFPAAKAADLEAIYGGSLAITINRVQKLVALDLHRFLQVPQTQQSSAANWDEQDTHSGFIKLTPQIVLDGSATNEIKAQFPSYAGWDGQSAVAGTEHRIVLYMRGLLVTGGSQNY